MATHAVLHTASGLPDGRFVVRLYRFPSHAFISVIDLGIMEMPGSHELRSMNDECVDSGLLIVRALSTTIGIIDRGDDRMVWCEISLRDDPAR